MLTYSKSLFVFPHLCKAKIEQCQNEGKRCQNVGKNGTSDVDDGSVEKPLGNCADVAAEWGARVLRSALMQRCGSCRCCCRGGSPPSYRLSL